MSDISFDDFSRWRVLELKYYLHDCGLKTSGKKAELVATAYGTSQKIASWKPTVIEEHEKNKHDYQKLLKITDSVVIPRTLF
jgi:hypothetical protein